MSDENAYDLSYHFVAFRDVIGQRVELRQLRGLLTSEDEKKEAERIVRETAGTVIQFRKTFQNFFDGFMQPTGLLDSLPSDKQKLAAKIRRDFTFQGFSDCLVVSVPLKSNDEYCSPTTG